MIQASPLELAVLRLTGSDRIAFLHGQTTNDIRGLPVLGSCRALVLNARGQIEFDLRVLRRTDDLLVFCRAGLEQALFERLKRYIIFDDVQLELRSDWQLWHMVGETSSLENAVVMPVNRGFTDGVDVLLPRDAQVLSEPLPNLELTRILAGLPDAHSDAFLGFLPQECGLEPAVSYRKGCYIGQEIMARLEARGNTRYALQRVQLGQTVEIGTPVLLETREVGQIGAVIAYERAWTALAVLRRDLEPMAALTAATIPVQVLVQELAHHLELT